MSQKTKTGKKRPHKKRQLSLSQRERNSLMSLMRLVYCWRYVDHARAESRKPGAGVTHGYNLLTPSKPSKVDAAYALATNKPMHWQVIVIGYITQGNEEYRNWAWVKSRTPIVAAGDGITPLLSQANDHILDDLDAEAECYARGVIMAPWDDRHPIRPARLAARLKTRLGLSQEEIDSLDDWDEPETLAVDTQNLDLDIARAMREAEKSTDVEIPLPR